MLKVEPRRNRRLLGLMLLVGAPLAAPSAASSQDLPDGRALIDRYVELIGGRDAVLSREFIRSTGQFQMPAMGVTGDLTAYQSQSGKNAVRVSIPGLGEIRSGFDGEVGWSLDPIQGPRVMDGEELEQTREEASFASSIRDESLVESVETLEQGEMNGEACWRVLVRWNSGRETTDCYSVESGLMVASVSSQESPMGTIQVTSLLSDYRELGGFLMPTRMTQQMMGQEQVMVFTDVRTCLWTNRSLRFPRDPGPGGALSPGLSHLRIEDGARQRGRVPPRSILLSRVPRRSVRPPAARETGRFR
jgi:hypothetical protein